MPFSSSKVGDGVSGSEPRSSLLVAATHFRPSPSTHLALPGARQLSPTQQAVLQKCEQLVPDLLVLQARNQLMLACHSADMPKLQSILNQYSPGPVMIRPLAPNWPVQSRE